MPKFGTITFKGQSGKEYAFTAYSRDTEFKDVAAVYFMTKRTVERESPSHTRIYVGQTDSLERRPLNHERKACFDKHGANCVCVLVESSQKTRLAIETDIRQNYMLPCNRQ